MVPVPPSVKDERSRERVPRVEQVPSTKVTPLQARCESVLRRLKKCREVVHELEAPQERAHHHAAVHP